MNNNHAEQSSVKRKKEGRKQKLNDIRDALIAIRSGEIFPENSGEYWNQETIESLCLMYMDGVGLSDIALQLKRSELAVIQQLLCRNMLTQQSKPRTRKEKTKASCHCADCKIQDCNRCGKQEPDMKKEDQNAGNI